MIDSQQALMIVVVGGYPLGIQRGNWMQLEHTLLKHTIVTI